MQWSQLHTLEHFTSGYHVNIAVWHILVQKKNALGNLYQKNETKGKPQWETSLLSSFEWTLPGEVEKHSFPFLGTDSTSLNYSWQTAPP